MNSDADDLLPLPPATFHILVALADGDRHGYAIMQEVAGRTGGALKLSAGTLYRSIQRMLEQGLVIEVGTPAGRQGRRAAAVLPDQWVRPRVAKAEAQRLAQMLALARASGFAPRKA